MGVLDLPILETIGRTPQNAAEGREGVKRFLTESGSLYEIDYGAGTIAQLPHGDREPRLAEPVAFVADHKSRRLREGRPYEARLEGGGFFRSSPVKEVIEGDAGEEVRDGHEEAVDAPRGREDAPGAAEGAGGGGTPREDEKAASGPERGGSGESGPGGAGGQGKKGWKRRKRGNGRKDGKRKE